MDLLQKTETFVSDDQSWLGSAHSTDTAETVTLDITAFGTLLGSTFTDGFIPSGVCIAKITSGGAAGKWGPYSPGTVVQESISFAVDGTGGTWTITFQGETTGNINWNATPADVKAALEALPGVNLDDFVVTGGPGSAGAGTPYVVTARAGGQYSDQNAPDMTAADALTGGAGTVTPTITQGGGTAGTTDGTQDPATARLIFHAVRAKTGDTGDKVAAAIWHGQVIESKLPTGHGVDAAAKAGGLRLIDFV